MPGLPAMSAPHQAPRTPLAAVLAAALAALAAALAAVPGTVRAGADPEPAGAPAPSLSPAPTGRHVVVLVWDGMRPDFVTPELTPNLWRLQAAGVRFARHHPVYLSATEVNGTAIATGCTPAHSTIIANVDFRPAIDPAKPIAIEALGNVRRGDAATGGRYIARPTVAEILHAAGLRTAIAGSKPIAMLHDRSPRPDDGSPLASPIVFEGAAMPGSIGGRLGAALGTFPPLMPDQDKAARDVWTTGALVDVLWRDGVPPYSLLWLAEPDASQHATGPGAPQALAAVRGDDRALGRVLSELDRRGLRASTDVFVVSDHGFSTIGRRVDVAVQLSAAGFNATRAALGGLHPGQVLVASNGGSDLLYVGGHDAGVCRRLAAWLQARDWVGVVLSRTPLEGTFPLSEARVDSPQAPDLIVSLRWETGPSATGAPGLQVSDTPDPTKRGNHASLSPYDMHNTLVAAGPDIRVGAVDDLPTGNTDIAPTILWILGLRGPVAAMDGRVLSEALTIDAPALHGSGTRRLVVQARIPAGVWEQTLQVSEVNGVRYLDQGSGALTPPRGVSAPGEAAAPVRP